MGLINVKNLNKEFIVSKSYKNMGEYLKGLFDSKKVIVHAVKDVSFEIGSGEIVGYIGPNGAGKSTTIKMLTGIIVPTSGVIEVDGITPYKNRKSYVKNIGVVFGQRSQLWWDLPARDSFSLLKDIYKIPDKDYKSNICLFNEVLDIQNIMDRPVRQLSLGQRMRCEIAASFLHNPKIVYLDEPTIGLDIIAKEKIRKVIKHLNKEMKCTIILTTHDMSDIEELCERVMVIDKGKLVCDAGIDDIKKLNGQKKYVTVDFENDITLNFEDIKVISDEGRRKKLCFDNSLISVLDVIHKVGSVSNIIDLDIQGQPIEEIVKEIYAGKISTI